MSEYIFNDEIVDNDNLPEDINPYSDGRPIYKVTGELIRCKECKHRPTINGEYENGFSLEFPDYKCPCQCDDGWYSWMPKDDWFCGNGERKEEFDCNDCYYSMQNCKDISICCEDETALCDNFKPVAERKER